MIYARSNKRPKLDQKADILDMYWNKGMLQSDIAKAVKLSLGTVTKIVTENYRLKSEAEKVRAVDHRSNVRSKL